MSFDPHAHRPPPDVIRCWQAIAAGQPCPDCDAEPTRLAGTFSHWDSCVVSRWGRALVLMNDASTAAQAEEADHELAALYRDGSRLTERGSTPRPPVSRWKRWRRRAARWIAGIDLVDEEGDS